MKKVLVLSAILLSTVFVACEGTEKTEDVGVGIGSAVSGLEALSDTTTVKDTVK